ncbi:fumarylacetoacetate hydrolase family protein [Desulfomarina sp.]
MSLWNYSRENEPAGFPETLLATGGQIYGVVLNDSHSLSLLGEQLKAPPYKAAPHRPVMYLKPRNTISGNGSVVSLPTGKKTVEVAGVLGVVIGRPLARLSVEKASLSIAAYVTVADLSLPHHSYFRPAIREKCFDGACPVGEPVAAEKIKDPAKLEICTFVNDERVGHRTLKELHRPVDRLLADISEFMTLDPGDVLLTGIRYQAPLAKPGDRIKIEIEGVGSLQFSIKKQGEQKLKTAEKQI